ncbi:helix-turn-helix domain-containing protein [Paenibacillus tyrfis]|uniref:helix-turn-helix domain-containing protein n=1 Tax=Paenibacillus tyrfis TaxID=1501230 RepID=UPI002166ADF5|nr:helix-turn-helix domain-containing protein [Paenibacillus tyrfis]
MEANNLSPTLNVRDAAVYLKLSKATIDRRISSGDLKSYKNGRLRRIAREDLLDYEARLKSNQSKKGVNKPGKRAGLGVG